MATATLNGVTITRLAVQLPAWGLWFADVELDQPTELDGSVTLVVADATYVGTIVSGGIVTGRARYRVVGGAGGWGQEIPSKHWANDAGVKYSTILQDAATAVGETIEGIPTGTAGSQWTREAGPASWQLEVLFPSGWYVGVDGVTRIGSWPSGTYTGGAAQVEPLDASIRRVTLAADSIVELVPGVDVAGVQAVDVHHSLEDGKLRTVVWGAGASETSRAVSAWRAIQEALGASDRFRGTFEYRIVSQSGERLNLQVTRRSTGMPDLRRVRVRPGVPGASADHKLGSTVLVTFVNHEPNRPAVVQFDDPESPGFLPQTLVLDASLAVEVGPSALKTSLGPGPVRLPIAYQGSTAQCGPFTGMVTLGSLTTETST